MLTSSVHDYYLQDMSTTSTMHQQQIVAYVCMLLLLCKKVIFTEHLRSAHVKQLKRTIESL